MRSSILSIALLAGVPAVAIVGCSNAPKTISGQQELRSSAQLALQEAYRRDPTLQQTLNGTAGYAVFPTVGKGGLIVGGSYGKGVLYENNQVVGFCDITSLSAGAKIGGQEYSQIIAFETQKPLAQFKNGNFALKGEATAVALRSGVAASTQFRDNVAVFVYDQGGLMADASVGGQSFRFTRLETAQQAAGQIEGEQSIDRAGHQRRLQGDWGNAEVDVDTDRSQQNRNPRNRGSDIDVDADDNGVDVDVRSR